MTSRISKKNLNENESDTSISNDTLRKGLVDTFSVLKTTKTHYDNLKIEMFDVKNELKYEKQFSDDITQQYKLVKRKLDCYESQKMKDEEDMSEVEKGLSDFLKGINNDIPEDYKKKSDDKYKRAYETRKQNFFNNF